jgi:hypothetical protein
MFDALFNSFPEDFKDEDANIEYNPENFRFSQYFLETKNNCSTKTTGAWLKSLDYDTICDFISVFKKIDDQCNLIHQPKSEISISYLDLLLLTLMLVEWECNKKITINDQDRTHKQTEYVFRLAFLIQIEDYRRKKLKNETMEDDCNRYHGKLSIYE